jgi:hypothetical protein
MKKVENKLRELHFLGYKVYDKKIYPRRNA